MRYVHFLVGVLLAATALAVHPTSTHATPDDFTCSVSMPTPGGCQRRVRVPPDSRVPLAPSNARRRQPPRRSPEIYPVPDFFFVWLVRDDVAVQLLGGEFGYGGTAIGVSPFGEYEVRYWYEGVRVSTRCSGFEPEPFVCRVADGELSWPKFWARNYVVRQHVSGANVFVERTGQTSTALANEYGRFTVSYELYGETFTTSCDGILLDDFECVVDGDQLSWGDQQASIYHRRQRVDGTDVYIGNSAETSWSVDDPRGDFVVIYRRDGSTFRTTCSA